MYRLLLNRFYIGEVQYQCQWYPGVHEPLIDRETWDRVQIMLGNRSNAVLNFTYGGGLVHCGHCGGTVVGEQITKKASGKQYRYFRCSQYVKAEGHPRDRATEAELDQRVLAMFDRLHVEDPEVREWFVKVLHAHTLEERLSAKAAVAEATRQLNAMIVQKERLIDMRMAGEIDADEFLERKTRMRDEEARLQLQLDKAERDREEVVDLAVRTFELSQSLKNKWVTADFDARRRILEILWSNLQVRRRNSYP
jgi:site-specific DNA recombinase